METFSDDQLKATIVAETGQRPAFAFEAFPDAQADVVQTIRRIRTSPFIPHTDNVRGFVYDVRTGTLQEVTTS